MSKSTRETSTSGNVLKDVLQAYKSSTSPSLRTIDIFLAYVLVTGIVQFIYCLIVGTFPFNAFLAGFLSTVGVFVLTVSLRMQLDPANRSDPSNRWTRLSPRRALADWLFCNLILHLAVLNFLG